MGDIPMSCTVVYARTSMCQILARLGGPFPRLRARIGALPAPIRFSVALVAVTLAVVQLALVGRAWAGPEPGYGGSDDVLSSSFDRVLDWGQLLDWGQQLALPAALDAAVNLILMAGVAAVLFMSWRTQRLAAVAIRAAQGGTSTERWRTAVDLLSQVTDDGSRSTEARLGAIYALEQAARETPPYRGPTFELMTAYVRHHAAPGRTDLQPAVDVQSILTVLGRSHIERLDLRRTALWGI